MVLYMFLREEEYSLVGYRCLVSSSLTRDNINSLATSSAVGLKIISLEVYHASDSRFFLTADYSLKISSH